MEKENQTLLRGIPKVDELLREEALARSPLPAALVRESVRQELDGLRAQVRSGACAQLPGREALCSAILKRARREALSTLRPVINGTGVVLHTNLGRACLSKRAAGGGGAGGGPPPPGGGGGRGGGGPPPHPPGGGVGPGGGPGGGGPPPPWSTMWTGGREAPATATWRACCARSPGRRPLWW